MYVSQGVLDRKCVPREIAKETLHRIKWIYRAECWQAPAVLKWQQVIHKPPETTETTWWKLHVRRMLRKQDCTETTWGHIVHQRGDLTKAPVHRSRIPSPTPPGSLPARFEVGNWLRGGKTPTLTAPPSIFCICGNKCSFKVLSCMLLLDLVLPSPHWCGRAHTGSWRNCYSTREVLAWSQTASAQLQIAPSQDSSASSLIQHLKAFLPPHRWANGRRKWFAWGHTHMQSIIILSPALVKWFP